MRRTGITLAAITAAVTMAGGVVLAQNQRPMSPRGTAATQVGGSWTTGDEPQYQNGKWIEIDYGRPIKRGRENLFGSGADYGKTLNAGAPVWRAGANQSTRLKTEVPLTLGGKQVPAGDYAIFIDLKPGNWTLIVSNWATQKTYDPKNKTELWGSYDYTPDKDVVRVPMKVEKLPFSMDQLTWSFLDMTDAGGRLAIMWDDTIGSVPFTVAK